MIKRRIDFPVLLGGQDPAADFFDDFDELSTGHDHEIQGVLEFKDDVTRKVGSFDLFGHD